MKRKFLFLGVCGALLLAGTAVAYFPDTASGGTDPGLGLTCNAGNCTAFRGVGTGNGQGVSGEHAGTGTAVLGNASSSSAVNRGVIGQTASSQGIGVQGYASSSSGNTIGVAGQADSSGSSVAVHGLATASSGATIGTYGQSNSASGFGMFGVNVATTGDAFGGFFRSDSTSGLAVRGFATTSTGSTIGVSGLSNSASGKAVAGVNINNGTGVYGESNEGYAGFFSGKAYVSGSFVAGATTLSSLGVIGYKSFHIDHPLDPANKYLNHAAIESSEVLNQYSGNVQLDAHGEAWVTMPSWFEAMNKDMRYQLTAIGAPGPNLFVAEKLRNNRFKIAGGAAGTEVSWQLTGVRHDAYAVDHPMVVEAPKAGHERGFYLYPQGHGQSERKSILGAKGLPLLQLQGQRH